MLRPGVCSRDVALMVVDGSVLFADFENDADAFIAAIRAGGMESTHALDVAERLIAANRPAEALDWLDKPRRRVEDEHDDGTDTDLRIAALDALGVRTRRKRSAGDISSGS
jgi:hypothetical protein